MTLVSEENKLSIAQLCQCAGVSRSGFYNWRKVTRINQEKRERQDEESFDLILEAYNYRGKPKGRRAIHMWLIHHKKIIMNPKKINRLMNKYRLICPVRRPHKNRIRLREMHQGKVKKNLLARQFKANGPRSVLLTDISYLPYGMHHGEIKWAYLSSIQDAFTNEILAYSISPSLELDFVLDMIKQLTLNHGISLSEETLIHSDQGVHYTAIKFQTLVRDSQLRQSMSRRGNCWDNAPKESFFGHLKDQIDLDPCIDYESVVEVIDDAIDYYNHERYQWRLAKLAPTQYYDYYMTGIYPLGDLIPAPRIPEVRTVEFEEDLSQ